jgi:hypothetical protein
MKTTHAVAESTHTLWASPDEMATDVSWALRVAGGTMLALWGVATLGPVMTEIAQAPTGHALQTAWFTIAIGMALGASGAMLMTNKLVPLAMTLLLPVGVHFLFQFLVLNG